MGKEETGRRRREGQVDEDSAGERRTSREKADAAHHDRRPHRHVNGTTDRVQNDETGTIRDRSVKTSIN